MNEQVNLLAEPQIKERRRLNLVLFLCGAIFTFMSFYSSMTVLPLYVYELGGTEFDIGLQSTLFFSVSILMRFYFGPLTDRKGRKLPLMIGAFVFATSSILFLLCDSVWTLTFARIYHAAGLASFFSSGGSLIVDLAPPNRVGLYIGLFRLTFVLGLLVGPSLAMAIINSYSFSVWFIVCFFIGLLSLLLIALVKPPTYTRGQESGTLQKFSMVLKERAAHQVYYGIFLTTFAYGVLLTFVVLFISQHTSMGNPGLYFTLFSIVGIFGNMGSGYLSDRYGRAVIAWPSVMLIGSGVGVLYFLPQIPQILFLSIITAGLGYSGGMASLAAWLVEVTNKENRGTVLALQESVIDLGVGMSTFIFGVLSGFSGMGGSFAIIGGTVLLAAIFKVIGKGRKSQSPSLSC